jgi:hypothetical protein
LRQVFGGTIPGVGFHDVLPEGLRQSRSARHSLPGLLALSASTRFGSSGQKIRGEDGLFPSATTTPHAPFAPAVPINASVGDYSQAAEKFAG